MYLKFPIQTYWAIARLGLDHVQSPDITAQAGPLEALFSRLRRDYHAELTWVADYITHRDRLPACSRLLTPVPC